MNLIRCENCNKKIGIIAPYCKYCGRKNKRRKYVFISFALLIFVVFIFILARTLISNQSYYSQKDINNIQLKQETIRLFRENGLSERIVISYVKDCMEQYNFAFKNKKVMELTDAGNRFVDYFNNDFEAKYQDEFSDVILDFMKIAITNADYIVNKLPIKITVGENLDNNLIIDENYYEYKDAIKEEIDTILQKYFIKE